MKRLGLLFTLFMQVLLIVAGDDIMITRDGSMITVKVEKISSSQVTFIDLKHKKRGRLSAPVDFVYMIMKEKGNNVFFDEEGNQFTLPTVKMGKKDNVMFLNNGEIFPVFNMNVGKDEISYQLKDKKKAPRHTVQKSEIFMVRNNEDETNTLYNNKYHERMKQQSQTPQTTAPNVPAPSVSQPAQPTSNVPAQPTSQPAQTTSNLSAPAASETSQPQQAGGMALLASNTEGYDFRPAPDMPAAELEMAVNAKNPYTLYRKGAVAEYCFQHKGKQTQYMGGPTFVQQTVVAEKIENGLLVSHIEQGLFNKKHEPSKGVAASFKECLFPTEIDTTGTYHWTHNIMQDFIIINKRRGYGVLIPGVMKPGMQLKCSTLYDNAKNLFGGTVKVETVYSDWQVVAEEQITTPAGTFDCVKLTGTLSQKQGSNGKFVKENITCWMARGVGVVQYETVSDSTPEPFVMYLNKLDLK